MNMVKKGVAATPIGEAGQGFSAAQKVLRMSGALRQNWRGVHPLQPDRQMQPSRARLLLRQRTNFRIWKTWAGKTKQLALSPRIYGSGTLISSPLCFPRISCIFNDNLNQFSSDDDRLSHHGDSADVDSYRAPGG
jgi:hypothetical protein